MSILFWNFFRRKYLQILLWKKICQKLLPIFLQNILYKTLFVINFVENTCKFYNFVRNDYPQRNYLQIKILRKYDRKKYFLANFFNKFARKILCNIRISSIVWSQFGEEQHFFFNLNWIEFKNKYRNWTEYKTMTFDIDIDR